MKSNIEVNFSHVILYVKSVTIAEFFYTNIIGLKPHRVNENKLRVEFKVKNISILFLSDTFLENMINVNLKNDYITPTELVFTTEEPEQLYELALQNGATAVKRPEESEDGLITAIVRDPNGVLIRILCYD